MMVRGLTFHLLQNKRKLLDKLHGIIIDLIVHGSVMVCLDIWLETLKSNGVYDHVLYYSIVVLD